MAAAAIYFPGPHGAHIGCLQPSQPQGRVHIFMEGMEAHLLQVQDCPPERGELGFDTNG